VGSVKCFGAGSLAANFISRQICKRTLKKIVEKQKREKEKNTLFPEILKTTRFLEKTCNQEFQQNKPEATAMALTRTKPPEISPEIQLRCRAPNNGI